MRKQKKTFVVLALIATTTVAFAQHPPADPDPMADPDPLAAVPPCAGPIHIDRPYSAAAFTPHVRDLLIGPVVMDSSDTAADLVTRRIVGSEPPAVTRRSSGEARHE